MIIRKPSIIKQGAILLIICLFALLFDIEPISAQSFEQQGFKYTVTDGNIEIIQYDGIGGSITIPSVIDGKKVIAIGIDAFKERHDITNINLPSCLESINSYAFTRCTGLTGIKIPASVKMVESTAFMSCNNLQYINVEADNEEYTSENGVLFNKGLTILMRYPCGKSDSNYVVPDQVTYLGDYSFSDNSNLVSIDINSNCTRVGIDAFVDCMKLESITVSEDNSQYTSEDGVLFNKDKTELLSCPNGKTGCYTIPESVRGIGDAAFYKCSKLTEINIPDSISGLGYFGFSFCSGLREINVPEKVKVIENYTFMGCRNLNAIKLSRNVENIGSRSFNYCDKLMKIEVDENNTAYTSKDGVLFDKAMTTLLQYPGGKIGSYTVPDKVQSIETFAFCGCNGLTSVSFPDSVREIDIAAFSECSNLSAAFFYGDAPHMYNQAFSGNKDNFTVYYLAGKTEFSPGTWFGYPAAIFTNGPKPAALAGLKVVIGGNKANLTWKATKGALYYNIYYKKQDGSYTLLTTKNTKLQITNLQKSSNYYFKVVAVNAAGEGKSSTEISKKTEK